MLKASYSHSSYNALFFILLFLTTRAQAQDISFFPATSACNGPNYPCLGVELCCPLPAVCIPDASSGSLRYICVGAAGFPVNGGASTTLPGGGLISASTTVKISPVVGPTVSPVSVVVPSTSPLPSPPGSVIVTPLPLPSTTPIPLPSTSISRASTSSLLVPSSTALGNGNGGGNGNGAATPVNPPTIATSIRPSSSSAVTSSGSGSGNSSGNGSGSGGGNGSGSGGGTGGGQGGGSGGNSGSGSGSGSGSATPSTTGTAGSGNSTVPFKGVAAPRAVIGHNYWVLVIAAGVIAGAGASVVE